MNDCTPTADPQIIHQVVRASVLLAGSGFIDLGALESREAGDALIEGLWDASEERAVSDRTKKVIQRFTC